MENNKLNIREYLEKDFPEITQLWVDTDMGGTFRADNREIIQNTLTLGGRLVVLEDRESKEILGTSWLTMDGRRIYLHHFGIKPEHQGKGYSKYLLDASLEFAKSTGLQIKLEVHRNNELATQLYSRAGFQYLGDYLVYIIRDYNSN